MKVVEKSDGEVFVPEGGVFGVLELWVSLKEEERGRKRFNDHDFHSQNPAGLLLELSFSAFSVEKRRGLETVGAGQ